MEKSKYILTVVAAILSGLVAFYTAFLGRPAKHPDEAVLSSEQLVQVKQLAERIVSLEAQLNATQAQLAKPTSLPPDVQLPVEIKKLQGVVEDVSGRLSKLENAILATPAKALEIPLLQRDLENIKASQQTMIASVKDGVDRVYDLNKWLLGAMAVSVISLAIASFLKGKEPAKAKV